MSEKIIKNTFVSGDMVSINGKTYTRMLSKSEIQERKKIQGFCKFTEKEIDERMEEHMRTEYPELYKRTYERKNN